MIELSNIRKTCRQGGDDIHALDGWQAQRIFAILMSSIAAVSSLIAALDLIAALRSDG